MDTHNAAAIITFAGREAGEGSIHSGGEEVGVGDSDINEVGEEGMLGVVLLLSVIEVLGVLINSVRSKDVLEESEGVVVFVVD